jgi:predicted amidophosphoribosyltransferase
MSEVEMAAADAVIDLEAENAACPACLGNIPQGSRMCPECGLRLG